MIKRLIERLKRYYKIRKIENEIISLHVSKEFYGEIDTASWWFEIQRLEKELAKAKND